MNKILITITFIAFATSASADGLKTCQTYSDAKMNYEKNDCKLALPLLQKSLSDCKPSDEEKKAVEKAISWCKQYALNGHGKGVAGAAKGISGTAAVVQ